MTSDLFIGVDWGTSRLRASLCRHVDGGARELETHSGPGVLAARGRIEATLLDAVGPWAAAHGPLPLILAGMVGSNIGWRHLDYAPCPAQPTAIAERCLHFSWHDHPVTMVPGLECQNDLGQPDVMRGEELQVVGWLADDPDHGAGEWLVCLPGTHTKWVTVRGGRIEGFRTAITGELHSLLARYSVLLAQPAGPTDAQPVDRDAFADGVDAAADHHAAILHLLFSARSRMLKGLVRPEAAASYLSGLLVGADCATAVDRRGGPGPAIAVIGEPELCRLFAAALRRLGADSSVLDGRQASVNGFARVFRELDLAATPAAVSK